MSKRQISCLSPERLRQLLSYEPETGEFRWLVGERAGSLAGGLSVLGYHRIGVDRSRFWSHRLAWLYVYGKWPDVEIDHIDGDKANNRIANLREATSAQNLANRAVQSNNKSGFKGVSWAPNVNMWRALVMSRGVRHHLGYFKTKEEAHRAYVSGAQKHQGEFAHVGAPHTEARASVMD